MTPARHTKSSSYYYFVHVAMLQKFAGPLVGPLFRGAPVRPNMLNMPKSASACQGIIGLSCSSYDDYGADGLLSDVH